VIPAPPCLVLHGWPGTDHTYLRAGSGGGLDLLAQTLRPEYHDHLGHAANAGGDGAGTTITMEALADDAGDAARRLGSEPVMVFGHFHGAGVAMELAVRHPELVRSLVLLAATPGELGMAEDLVDTFAANIRPPEAEILQRVPPESDDELAATMRGLESFFWADPARAPGTSVFARTAFSSSASVAWTQSLNSWSVVDRLQDITAPVLLITGRHDVFAPPEEARRIAKRAPRSELVVLETGGHLAWLEEPEAFTATVADWLSRNR